MSNKYSHLLSPLKIGNVILKNRMLSANALPHFLQGPETFPSDAIMSYYANVAKNGAAVVTCRTSELRPRKNLYGDMAHMSEEYIASGKTERVNNISHYL